MKYINVANKKICIAIVANGGTFSCSYFIRTFEHRFIRKKMKIDKAHKQEIQLNLQK